jgi:DNA-binding response OmpR family regulator
VRILLVEDSRRLQEAIGTGLHEMGYAVDISGDGEDGLWRAETGEYDVIVLDIMLPKLDGLTVLGRLREQGKTTHVLILTARDKVEDRVRGLQLGADDYLVKPFNFLELVARIQALARRAHGIKTPRITLGELLIDTSACTVTRAGEPIELTPREYALLEFLTFRRGQVVSRTQIEQHIYDDRVELASNVVDSTICMLRRKVDRPGVTSLIQTRRGLGYILEEPSA